MNYLIAREGWPFILIAAAIFIFVLVIGSPILTISAALLLFFVTWFFRNPERTIPEGDGLVVSPADGRVIDISRDSGGTTKVSIFMSVFNVHVNRVPVAGVVKKIEYNKGKFFVASFDKASSQNERNTVVMQDEKGREIKFVQIAGLVARRIVCYLKDGDHVERGMRFGMIRFGSRMDIYLPPGFAIRAKKGDNVSGGATILGEF